MDFNAKAQTTQSRKGRRRASIEGRGMENLADFFSHGGSGHEGGSWN